MLCSVSISNYRGFLLACNKPEPPRTCRQTSQVPGASTMAAMAAVKPALYSRITRVWFRVRKSCQVPSHAFRQGCRHLCCKLAKIFASLPPQKELPMYTS